MNATVCKLISAQTKLTSELEDMAVLLSQKDAEITCLKVVALQIIAAEGPGIIETLRAENGALKGRVRAWMQRLRI